MLFQNVGKILILSLNNNDEKHNSITLVGKKENNMDFYIYEYYVFQMLL